MPTKTATRPKKAPEVQFTAPSKSEAKATTKTASKSKSKVANTTKQASNGKTKATPATTTAVKAKAPAKKAATKKAAAVPAKKAAPAATKKAPAKKKVNGESKATGGQSLPRVLNEHGFVVGSNSEKVVELLLVGGESRADVTMKASKALKKSGEDSTVNSLIANVLRRLKDKGYTIESTWKLNPPTPASKRAATRRAKAKEAEGGEAVKDTKTVATTKRRKVAKKS